MRVICTIERTPCTILDDFPNESTPGTAKRKRVKNKRRGRKLINSSVQWDEAAVIR